MSLCSTVRLDPTAVAAALSLRDLTDPADGRHAVQLLLDAAVAAVGRHSTVSVQRGGAAVAVEDNYDRLGYAPSAVTREPGSPALRPHDVSGEP
jgi:phenylalanyl-tRNA synthetase alpha chain